MLQKKNHEICCKFWKIGSRIPGVPKEKLFGFWFFGSALYRGVLVLRLGTPLMGPPEDKSLEVNKISQNRLNALCKNYEKKNQKVFCSRKNHSNTKFFLFKNNLKNCEKFVIFKAEKVLLISV